MVLEIAGTGLRRRAIITRGSGVSTMVIRAKTSRIELTQFVPYAHSERTA